MRLHEHSVDFADLSVLAATWMGLPIAALTRDYYIVMMLQRLERSEFADSCIFKGGTSLSKCYPGSINRFSEDIDLTFVPQEQLTPTQYDRRLKRIETTMSDGFRLEKIPGERNNRNKSAFVWFDESDAINGKIKLEIGSSIRPDPYSKMIVQTYIQNYLVSNGMQDVAEEYALRDVHINALDITRTFLDKVLAVKRHATCGNIGSKVRHIYDVTVLFERDDIQHLLSDINTLKKLLATTKETDRFYLEKRDTIKQYDPVAAYNFPSWKENFNSVVRRQYEKLHEDLLYTNDRQDFDKAISTFEKINKIFSSIEE